MPRPMLSDDQCQRIDPVLPSKSTHPVGPQETIDCLSRPCYGSHARIAHEPIFRPILNRRIACANALRNGLRPACHYEMRHLPWTN